MSSRGAGDRPLTYEGEFTAGVTYLPRQLVLHDDSPYMAIARTTDDPTTTPADWLPFGGGDSNHAGSGIDSIQLGDDSLASGDYATAVGDYTHATAEDASAFGSSAWAVALGATAFGDGAYVDGLHAIGIGGTGVYNQHGIGIGYFSEVNADYAIALGYGANIASVSGSGIAIGKDAQVEGGLWPIAIGLGAEADGAHTVAIGASAQIVGADSVGIGYAAFIDDTDVVAVGKATQATAQYAVAVGAGASVAGIGGVAVGASATAPNQGGVAVGVGANSDNTGAIAIGNGAVATGSDGSIAIGRSASASYVGSIALGDDATTTRNYQAMIGVTGANDYWVEIIGLRGGYVAKSSDGSRWKLVPPNGGGAATWVAA